MIDSIFVALSGMLGHQRGLNVISNNVANINTPGFRGSTVSFADVFIGAGEGRSRNPQASGERSAGVGLETPRRLLDTQVGEQLQTGRDLDLFLDGEGYFVLQDAEGAIRYSRSGRFEFNDAGQLVSGSQGLEVLARSGNGQLVPISLGELQVNPAKTTSEVTFSGNLSPGDAERVIEPLLVQDQQGGSHRLRLVFTRDTEPTTNGASVNWKLTVFEGEQQVGAGTVPFFNTQVLPGSSPLSLTLTLANTTPLELALNFDAATGFNFQSGTPVPGSPPPSDSTLVVQKQDGRPAGTITGQTFDAKGVLKITYSNGETIEGATLALAQIRDTAALRAIGDSLLVYLGDTPVNLRGAADDLRVVSQSIEQSNVDLTQQFSDLILMQRGYQASSQVLSTANDMLQQLLELRGRR